MELEIERKWLVPTNKWKLAKKHTKGQVWRSIEQGYISPEVRVRIYSMTHVDEAELCVKQRKTALTVREFNYKIPVEDAKMIMTKLSVIKKNRHNTDSEGYTLDYFMNSLKGLVIVEKEFASEELAMSEILPDWLDGCPEVTSDPAYINANLGSAMFVPGIGLVDSENLQTGDEEEIIHHDQEWESADLDEHNNIQYGKD